MYKETRKRTFKIVFLVLLLLMILVDASLLILYLNGYVLFFLKESIVLSFILAHVVIMLLFSISLSWARAILIISMPIVLGVGLGVYLYAHYALPQWSYQQFDSPQHKHSLVLRYRTATLGESHYFFETYQKSSNRLLLRHTPSDDFNFILQHDENYTGIQQVRWLNESTIQFDVQGTKKILSLNL
ncbi:hypothetical protein [Cohnella hashimotonis]|uniref:Uncharacterized protein n=1 Tax=Cohnella hashimotonis TaxID=2826895 RepID=A0ABT6TPU7_9BACL|nr:hypothetical protein [Cohnella hashimotonis]MDI4647847.1 hypothetical protein [Cohnella hashimotonis]